MTSTLKLGTGFDAIAAKPKKQKELKDKGLSRAQRKLYVSNATNHLYSNVKIYINHSRLLGSQKFQ